MDITVIIIIAAACAGIGYAIDGGRGALLGGLLSIPGLIICGILKIADAVKGK